MNLSLVIPLLNEEESLPELAAWIERVCIINNISYEVLFIDDGSRDAAGGSLPEPALIHHRQYFDRPVRHRNHTGSHHDLSPVH